MRALMCAEIGGSNGMVPFTWAARMCLPVLDADGKGRAFPEVQQVTMHPAGIPAGPAVIDERGHRATFRDAEGAWAERLERAMAIACGGIAASAEYTMTVAQARHATVPGTVSLAGRMGAAIRAAEADPVAEVITTVGAARLLGGKVADVERRIEGGFVRGVATIEGTRDELGVLSRWPDRESSWWVVTAVHAMPERSREASSDLQGHEVGPCVR